MTAAGKDPHAKVRNRPAAIFDNQHSKVTDDKDHFPIDTIGRARNALARVNQFDSSPEWWDGSLKELKSAVVKAVKQKYPSIEVSKKSKAHQAGGLYMKLLLNKFGMDDEADEYGPFSIENMTDDQLLTWMDHVIDIVQDTKDNFARLMLEQIREELNRRGLWGQSKVESQ